ncbi:hypothetical protein VPNG_02558 [Cytospora leucostoma]|uniref:NAD-dependent epimerase/dehydratase domain-containing protein n=1 Tax=Cytospora leucostoma TaxID=1230097 RepID=A0A423XHR8_9PEZI|nr:hypothetical protein VPNG_02558 [Cytospora leucostoma]
MTTSPLTPRILLLGATGYIGGTVLHHLLDSTHPLLGEHAISVLVRGPDRVAELKEAYGDRISPVLYSGLDDIDLITKLASQHDIVVNAGTGFHPASAEALVHGLSRRLHEESGGETRRPWIIHTSGCSNISDNPIAGDSHPDRWFDDADSVSVYEHEKAVNARVPYLQRTAELAVIDAGEETGVGAVVLQIPAIFGQGRGLFSDSPTLLGVQVQYVLEHGYGFMVGDGTGRLGVVHIEDLAQLYVLIVQRILDDGVKGVPSGKHGIVFPCVGLVQFADLAKGCVEAALRKGVLPKSDGPQTEYVRFADVDEIALYYGGGDLGRHLVELCWAGHWNTKGTVAGQLGWLPLHDRDEYMSEKHFDSELEAILAGRVLHLDSVTGQK